MAFLRELFDDAEAIYRDGVLRDRGRAKVLHLVGRAAVRQSQREFAVACLGVAASLAPDDTRLHIDLGDALDAVGSTSDALSVHLRVVSLAPSDPDAFCKVGQTLVRLGRTMEAQAVYSEAQRLDPNRASVHLALGDLFGSLGSWRKALERYRLALRLAPRDAINQGRLGQAYLALGKAGVAKLWFQRALVHSPTRVDLYVGLGSSLLRLGEPERATHSFRDALAIDPFDISACQLLIHALELLGRVHEAASAWHRLGVALESKHRYDAAEVAHKQALAKSPRLLPALIRLGHVQLQLNHPRDALGTFRRAIAIDPNSRRAHMGLGFAAHGLGDLQNGWKELSGYQSDAEHTREFQQPLWDGTRLDGRTILLWADWALGDTIQFVRYVPLVRACGARVLVECHKRLLPLIRRMEGIDGVFARGTPLPAFDVHAPMFSLPRIFDTDLASIPSVVPYLTVDPAHCLSWRLERQDSQKMTVGLTWSGEPGRENAAMRFTSLASFEPLADLQRIRFVSLQFGEPSIELIAPPRGLRVDAILEDTGTVMDTAALIMNLDLVISVDTMVVHLAGALAKTVWTLLPYAADWRWQSNGDTCPWYPTMRLFRQTRRGDWLGVLKNVRDALDEMSARSGEPPSPPKNDGC